MDKIKCGIDIVEHKRIEKSLKNRRFQEKYFTEDEIKYSLQKRNFVQHFAVRFAAKEAFLKALGTGIAEGISLKEIEVKNKENGIPFIELKGKVLEKFQSLNYKHIEVSLSHSENYSIAMVILF